MTRIDQRIALMVKKWSLSCFDLGGDKRAVINVIKGYKRFTMAKLSLENFTFLMQQFPRFFKKLAAHGIVKKLTGNDGIR